MTARAESILKLSRKADVPDIEAGDVVRVHQKIREGGKERIQVFEGIVIAVNHGKGVNASFTVRKIASGIGVEKVFLLHSPNITKVEFKRGSNVKRAKLYYLRALTGKALKMKDKDSKKDVWAEMLGQDARVKTEATDEDIAEAVKAEEERKAAEEKTQLTESEVKVEDNEPSGEANNESEQQNSGEEQPVVDQSDAGAGNDAESGRN